MHQFKADPILYKGKPRLATALSLLDVTLDLQKRLDEVPGRGRREGGSVGAVKRHYLKHYNVYTMNYMMGEVERELGVCYSVVWCGSHASVRFHLAVGCQIRA